MSEANTILNRTPEAVIIRPLGVPWEITISQIRLEIVDGELGRVKREEKIAPDLPKHDAGAMFEVIGALSETLNTMLEGRKP